MAKDKDKKSSRNIRDASSEYKILKDMVERLAKDFENVIKNSNLSREQKAKAVKQLLKRKNKDNSTS